MPQDEYTFDYDSDETGLVEATIYYCFTPGCAARMDPERPEPAEAPLVEVEKIEPEKVAKVLSFEEAEAIVWDMLNEPVEPEYFEREIDDSDF